MSDRDEFTQDAAWLAFHVRRLLGESPGTPAWEVVTSEAAEALADWDANRKRPVVAALETQP